MVFLNRIEVRLMDFFDGQNNYQDDEYEVEVLNESEDEVDDGYIYTLDESLEFNRINAEKYSDIINRNRYNTDDYWDINDPFVRGILGVLFFVGLIGSIYYIITWLFY